VVVITLIAIVAMIVFFVMWTPAWSRGIGLSWHWSIYDLQMNDRVVLVDGYSPRTFYGVNLETGRIAWKISGLKSTGYSGDITGFVIMTADEIEVIDPTFGTVMATAPMTMQDVGWAGNGMILTLGTLDKSMCGRRMSDPGRCLWTADNVKLTEAYGTENQRFVFGDGQWVNTGDGVLSMATGQPAPFGSDVSSRPLAIYYWGSTPDRVFRVVDQGGYGRDYGYSTYQPWDVSTNSAISPAVKADRIAVDSKLPVYVATVVGQSMDAPDVATAYSWQTGEQKWQITADRSRSPGEFVGGKYVMPSKFGTSAAQAIDISTGQATLIGLQYDDFDGVVQGFVITDGGWTAHAYDGSNGFARAWSANQPQGCLRVALVDYGVICAGETDAWVRPI